MGTVKWKYGSVHKPGNRTARWRRHIFSLSMNAFNPRNYASTSHCLLNIQLVIFPSCSLSLSFPTNSRRQGKNTPRFPPLDPQLTYIWLPSSFTYYQPPLSLSFRFQLLFVVGEATTNFAHAWRQKLTAVASLFTDFLYRCSPIHFPTRHPSIHLSPPSFYANVPFACLPIVSFPTTVPFSARSPSLPSRENVCNVTPLSRQ